jgi:integrase
MLEGAAMPARIPTYRLHKPTGLAVVTLDGKDHYLGRHGSRESRQAYDRLLAEYLTCRARHAPQAAPISDLTIDELLVAYWDHARAYYTKDRAPTSEQDTIRQALRPVRELYTGTSARAFGPLALKAVRNAMTKRGWCRGYINKQINRVKRVFAWAVENELLPVETYQALRTVAGLRKGRCEAREKPPIVPVSDEIVERTLPYLSPTVATMVHVQRLTGARPQEIILMRGDAIDRSGSPCWIYRPQRHKTQHHDRERLIFLGPRVQKLLRPFLEDEPVGYLFNPQRAEEHRRAEQRAQRKRGCVRRPSVRRKPKSNRSLGQCYGRGSYRKAIRRACIKARVPIWFPHQVRHAAASRFRAEFGLEIAQALLGHSEIGTTQIYAQVDRSAALRAMAEAG